MKITKQLNRSVFPVRYKVKGSFNLGEICPIGAPIEVVPYDTFNLESAMLIRMATPIAPIMDDIDAEVTAHFVPLRLISSSQGDVTNAGYIAAQANFNTFEKIIGNGLGNPADWMVQNNELYAAPTTKWNAANAKAATYTTIGEALGLGLGMGTSKDQNVLAYPLLGYNLIYQERFRNQDVETAKASLYQGSNIYGVSGSSTATSGTDTTYNHALSVAYKHGDRFTNAKPSPTKGTEVKIPLGTEAPLMTTSDIHDLGTTKLYLGDGATVATSHTGVLGVDGTDGYIHLQSAEGVSSNQAVKYTNMVTDLTNATAASINQFITAFNIQRLLMNDIKGTRYFELLENHFGVKNDDIRLYIPELLNIRRFQINISPVVQQSGAAASTSGTDQGNYLGTTGGYSVTGNKGALVHHTFGEFGYIFFLIVIRQSHTYGQGIPKLFLRSKRFDFFFPELGRIGYQKIDEVQLNADATPGTTYAWEPSWEELRRVNNDQVFGFLNPAKANSLDYWTLADNLSTTPSLNMAFLKENRTNLARALTIADQGPDFIMDALIYGKKATLVPIGNEPKLFN